MKEEEEIGRKEKFIHSCSKFEQWAHIMFLADLEEKQSIQKWLLLVFFYSRFISKSELIGSDGILQIWYKSKSYVRSDPTLLLQSIILGYA